MRLGIAVHRPRRSLLGDTKVAAPLEIGDCRARAQRVIEHRGPAEAGIALPQAVARVPADSHRRRGGDHRPVSSEPYLRRRGGMMVVPGDVAIKFRASGSSWTSRAYPPWTKRPMAWARDRVPAC
jgi:hypothetical protein